MSCDSTQTLADHDVLASVVSVGDAYDNALAESFVDARAAGEPAGRDGARGACGVARFRMLSQAGTQGRLDIPDPETMEGPVMRALPG
jgi:hypothetical protein